MEKEAAKVRPILSRLTPVAATEGTAETPAGSASDAAPPAASRKREGPPVNAEGDTGSGGVETGSGASSAKRFKSGPGPSAAGEEGAVTEEAIRRYLQRKPMTAKDLLLKFSRRLPLRTCEISKQIARILQKMKVQKRNHNGITLLSLTSN